MKLSRSFSVALLVLAPTIAGPARAEGRASDHEADGHGLAALGSPDVTLRTGVTFPMFLIYEVPGPLVGVTLEWPTSENLQVVARGELGAVFFEGAQRYLGKVGAGARVTPGPGWRVSPWLQLGFGTMAYVERIGVVLPERVASAVDVGVLLSADVAIGARIAKRWEIGVGWDHILWPLPYYEVYTGTEAQPYRGTAMAWFGVGL